MLGAALSLVELDVLDEAVLAEELLPDWLIDEDEVVLLELLVLPSVATGLVVSSSVVVVVVFVLASAML